MRNPMDARRRLKHEDIRTSAYGNRRITFNLLFVRFEMRTRRCVFVAPSNTSLRRFRETYGLNHRDETEH